MASIREWFTDLLGKSQPPKHDGSAPQTESEPRTATQQSGGREAVLVQETARAAPPSSPPAIRSNVFNLGWLTDVGRERGHNEDALLVFTGQQDASQAVPPFGLFMVADGMGGHQQGEAASSLALKVSASHLISSVYLPLLSGSDRGASQPSLTEVVKEAISEANRLVARDFPGSGSTLTCGMVIGSRLFIGHVGDSRAYLLREGASPRRLTRDHSFVSRLIEMGQLSEKEALIHPQRNVLYRAIGQPDGLEVDVSTYALRNGDRLLICSDGLWNMVDESEIRSTLASVPDPQNACSRLIDAANAAGGTDNVTVVYAEVNLTPTQ